MGAQSPKTLPGIQTAADRRRLGLVLLGAAILAGAMAVAASGGDRAPGEYDVKAIFCYHLLSFVEWPEAAFAHDPKTIIIGIQGRNPFGDAFEKIPEGPVNDRKVVVRQLPGNATADDLAQVQLLFISAQSRARTAHILRTIRDRPVLTVGEVDGFADDGGMINFVIIDGRPRFELNPGAARRVDIVFRSQLLRLAERIVNGAGDQ